MSSPPDSPRTRRLSRARARATSPNSVGGSAYVPPGLDTIGSDLGSSSLGGVSSLDHTNGNAGGIVEGGGIGGRSGNMNIVGIGDRGGNDRDRPDVSGVQAGGHNVNSFPPEDFVTQPLKPKKGLTGKISTLFRNRESSRERRGLASKGSFASNSTAASKNNKNTPTNRLPPGLVGGGAKKKSGANKKNTSGKDDDDRSVGNVSVGSHASRTSKRIMYSSYNDDEDSDDSYESRVSRASRTSRDGDDHGDDADEETSQIGDDEPKTILRYRGFSTSISSLFLDEPLVCASMGCFGLILSNRTEYLLQLRNERRGTISPKRGADRKRLPSRIVAYGLIMTILGMFMTFIVWGFGTGNGIAEGYVNGIDYNGNKNGNDDYYNNNGNNNNDQAADWENGEWDDYLQRDDDTYNNNQDDNADGYNGNNNADGYNGNNNANGYNGNNNANGYNGNNNNYNNGYSGTNYNTDDAAAAADDYYAADDDGNANNDDAANNNNDYAANSNDDAAAAADDYYTDDDGNRVRHLEVDDKGRVHKTRGVFKLRDYQQGLWDPIFGFIRDEWYRDQDESQVAEKSGQRHRLQQNSASGYSGYAVNSGSNSSGSASESGSDDFYNEVEEVMRQRGLAANIRVGLLFAFLLFLGILGRRRRMRTRFYLVRARAQEDHLYYASANVGSVRRVANDDSREDQYEGACSHTLCGCYPVDEVELGEESHEEVEVTDSGIFKRKKKRYHEDSTARIFNCLMATCCGMACKCWFQCLSVCALAQEAREIRLLLPPRYQRVDYITHQPFHEYQKAVNDLRRGWLGKTRGKGGIMPHFNALSRLARYILALFTFSLVAITATLLFNPMAAFSWQDAVVLAATFLQSFLVLFIVHWIFHKSDLSLDAVIKFFAAGFLIAVPTAFFFEGLLVNVILIGAWSMYELSAAIAGDVFIDWVFDHWRLIWILGELVNAYIVAAVTEEVCKYYTFRCVEHPDLIFLTGLNRTVQDDAAVDGGLVKYPFASHQVQELNRDNSFDNISTMSHRSTKSGRSRRSRRKEKDETLIARTGTRDDEFEEDDADVRTYTQKAMAITTGMIGVAVGLACAENFMYVFLLGGASGAHAADDEYHDREDVMEEWIVLFFRSIFPIHALAAAMQSINMIRKFVESSEDSGHRIGAGRIILPAVIIHGSFDAVLMGINVFVETAWDQYLADNDGNMPDEPPYNAFIVNLVAWVSITVIMLSGFLWYYRENRAQRQRLIVLEEKEKANSDGTQGSYAPKKELELV
jgi:hypothetical protein